MRFIIRCILLLCLLSISSGLLLETKSGQEKLINFLTRTVDEKFHVHARIGHIHCFLPFYIQLNDLAIENTRNEPLLSSSEVTLLPFPLPLSSESWLLPYVRLQSFHLHLQTLSKISSVKNKKDFFISIPSLHLLNGEAHDPSLPTPYTFSFDGGTRVENDKLFIEGELLDQTSILPLHKARGQLQVSEGIPQGWIQCSFKNESFMKDFRSLFIQFDQKGCSGSWKLDSHLSHSETYAGTLLASLDGLFSISTSTRKWFIDCTNMNLMAHYDAQKMFPWLPESLSSSNCHGSWRIEGGIETDRVNLAVQRFFLNTPNIRIQCNGTINYLVEPENILLNANLEGSIASKETDSTFTIQSTGIMNSSSKELTFGFSSPFARAEAYWQKTTEDEIGSFTTEIHNLSFEPEKHLFQSLISTCSYDSKKNIPYQFYFHVHEPATDQIKASAIDIKGNFTSLSPLDGSLELRVEKAKWQDLSLSLGKGLLEWHNNIQYGTLYLSGKKRETPWSVLGSGTIQKKEGAFCFECSDLNGQVGSIPISLRSQAIGSYNPVSGIKELNLDVGLGSKGFLSLTHNAGFRNTLILTFDDCPLAPFFTFFGKQDLSGKIGGKIMYTYGGKFPELHAQTAFQYEAYKDLPQRELRTIEGHSLITTRNNEVSIGMQLKELEEQKQIEFRGIIPILAAQSFPFAMLDYDSPIEGKMQGNTNISSIFAPFHDNSIIFQGDLTLNNVIGGTLRAPNISGDVHVENGYFVIPKIDGLLKNITADGTFFGSECIINTIKCTSEKGGSLYGNAILKFPNGTFQWNLNTFFSNMTIVDLPSMEMEGTGSISLESNANTLLIRGQTKLNSGVIDLAKAAPSYAPIQKQMIRKSSSVFFDIDLEADKTLSIRGRSFLTTWSGMGSLKGSTNQPEINLTSHCDTGHLLFAGRKMNIENGSLDIHGTFLKDSKLEVTAVTPLPQCTARLLLKGPLSRLKVLLRSSPQRSEREILSLLLFDKEVTAISPLESLQLANAALSLEKKNAGSTLLDTVKGQFGIDKINIGSSGPNPEDTALTVGKYISKGVAVTLSKDISSEANRVGLELDITDEIKANAMVGDDESAIMSLTWKKEF